MKGFNFDGYRLIVECRESDLVEYLGRQIPKIYGEDNCIVTQDYIFAKGTVPVILCAHMDTVFNRPPETVLYDPKQELIWSPEGIGGDDRNGIYTILKIISGREKDKLPSVLFTTQEEKGCIGARRAAKPLKAKVGEINFAIQIDRQGSTDAVFYQCKNREFIDYICSFGYKETPGSRTDICEICPEWDIAGVNFSCGYIHNHTDKEIVNVKDMFQTINMIEKILDDEGNKKHFPFVVKSATKTKEEKGVGAKSNVSKLLTDDEDLDSFPSGTFPDTPNTDDALLIAMFGDNK